jgi:hypothetical protein
MKLTEKEQCILNDSFILDMLIYILDKFQTEDTDLTYGERFNKLGTNSNELNEIFFLSDWLSYYFDNCQISSLKYRIYESYTGYFVPVDSIYWNVRGHTILHDLWNSRINIVFTSALTNRQMFIIDNAISFSKSMPKVLGEERLKDTFPYKFYCKDSSKNNIVDFKKLVKACKKAMQES